MALLDSKVRAMQNIRQLLGGHPSPFYWRGRGKRWKDFIDLLPGFAALEPDVAQIVYNNTGDITYRRAVSDERNDAEGDHVKGHPGIGFIEIPIMAETSRILLSPELQRAYLYIDETRVSAKPCAIARALMAGAGWNDTAIFERGVLNADQEIPYQALGAEIADEHREARRAALIHDSIARPYFTEDLIAYYVGARTLHLEEAKKYFGKFHSDEAAAQTNAAIKSKYISQALMARSKNGVKKLTLAKVRENEYDAVYDQLLSSPNAQAANPSFAVEKEWRRSRLIFQRVRSAAPAMIVGGITGAAVRIGVQFSMAALLATTPGIVAVMGSAVLAGALAGGASKFVTTAMFDVEGRSDPHWRRKAFLKGAAFGALGGLVGASVAQWMLSHDVHLSSFVRFRAPSPEIPNLLSASSVAPTPMYFMHDPVDIDPFAPEPMMPDSMTFGSASVPLHPVSSLLASQSLAAPVPQTLVPSGVEAASLPSSDDVRSLLTQKQFHSLPKQVRGLASSHDPRRLMQFCKEASYRLLNHHPHGTAAMKAGQRLLGYGVHCAETSNSHTRLAEKLYADYAYTKAWGIGGEADTSQAIENARLSGHAVHNYGARLFKLLRVPMHG